jgi:hypothetical protein
MLTLAFALLLGALTAVVRRGLGVLGVRGRRRGSVRRLMLGSLRRRVLGSLRR